uniref:LysM domain-containing protein n=1 Tax=Leptocylindrus danicus TaxID=163516 RepID=A0A7S2K0C8_9STRA|mmetsp:Transcript_15286/g.22565  ORF Transcript_15286/g.22565 Transcript_15286/m.22565 type:complete len:428 (+) Transcript_15286:1416-2699(+)
MKVATLSTMFRRGFGLGNNSYFTSQQQQQEQQPTILDGDMHEQSLPEPPKGMRWVRDRDTNVWALMPDRTPVVDAVASVAPTGTASLPQGTNIEAMTMVGSSAQHQADDGNSLALESGSVCSTEEWEMISDNEDAADDSASVEKEKAGEETSKLSLSKKLQPREKSGLFRQSRSYSDAGSSFESIHASACGSTASRASLLSPPSSSCRSFNSTLLKNVAALAVNGSVTSPVDDDNIDASTLGSLPSIRSGGSDTSAKVKDQGSSNSVQAYVEHVVLPSDTLQGICLSYKINASKLRQVNQFSGNSLLGAPKKLIIPLTRRNVSVGIKQQDQNSKEYKVHALISECPYALEKKEAQRLLEKTHWNIEQAIEEALTRTPRTKNGSSDNMSFEIAIQGNVAFPTKFINTVKRGGKLPPCSVSDLFDEKDR